MVVTAAVLVVPWVELQFVSINQGNLIVLANN